MDTLTFKVVKVFRKSGRRATLRKGLTRDAAIRVINNYPSSTANMVVFYQEN